MSMSPFPLWPVLTQGLAGGDTPPLLIMANLGLHAHAEDLVPANPAVDISGTAADNVPVSHAVPESWYTVTATRLPAGHQLGIYDNATWDGTGWETALTAEGQSANVLINEGAIHLRTGSDPIDYSVRSTTKVASLPDQSPAGNDLTQGVEGQQLVLLNTTPPAIRKAGLSDHLTGTIDLSGPSTVYAVVRCTKTTEIQRLICGPDDRNYLGYSSGSLVMDMGSHRTDGQNHANAGYQVIAFVLDGDNSRIYTNGVETGSGNPGGGGSAGVKKILSGNCDLIALLHYGVAHTPREVIGSSRVLEEIYLDPDIPQIPVDVSDSTGFHPVTAYGGLQAAGGSIYFNSPEHYLAVTDSEHLYLAANPFEIEVVLTEPAPNGKAQGIIQQGGLGVSTDASILLTLAADGHLLWMVHSGVAVATLRTDNSVAGRKECRCKLVRSGYHLSLMVDGVAQAATVDMTSLPNANLAGYAVNNSPNPLYIGRLQPDPESTVDCGYHGSLSGLTIINNGVKVLDLNMGTERLTDPRAVLTSHASGDTLSSSSETFTWSNVGAEKYLLYLGTTVGDYDLANEVVLDGSTSRTINSLPTNGSDIYIRLLTKTDGLWDYRDYRVAAAS